MGVQGSHPCAKFYCCGFGNVGYQKSTKIVKICIFCNKSGPKVPIPLSIFLQNWRGEGVPGLHPHVECHCCGFENVGLEPVKSKLVIFWYKFAPQRKSWGFVAKVEYRCTTTNLSLCNGTINVLKITPLHSVSVITNFVIPKRDK